MRPSPETLAELELHEKCYRFKACVGWEPHCYVCHVGEWPCPDAQLLAYIRDLEAVAEAARATRYWGGVGSMLDAALAALDNPGETGETG